jgi:hypothetical protein
MDQYVRLVAGFTSGRGAAGGPVMAFKITKKEAAELQALVDAYEAAQDALGKALAEIHEEWENEYHEKSEGWQESAAGQAAEDRIDTLWAMIEELPEGCAVVVEGLL